MSPKTLPAFLLFLVLFPAGRSQAAGDLDALCREFWESNMKDSPTWATSLGDHRYDDRLGDISAAGHAARQTELKGFLARAEAMDPAAMTPEDRITLHSLLYELRATLARLECELYLWNVGPRSGPQASLMNIASYQFLSDDPKSGRDMVSRWSQFDSWTNQYMANLQEGMAQGKTAPKEMVERVISMIEDIQSSPVDEWAALKTPLESEPQAWSAADRSTFESGLRAAVNDYAEALDTYKGFLKDELLPRARGREEAGLHFVPGGDDCYRALIYNHTSLHLEPEEIHQIGLDEVKRVNQQTLELGKKVLGLDDLEAIHKALREDPKLHFTTREEVEHKAEEALARAKAAIPEYFGILPKADCVVTVIGAHEERYTTIAYYRNPTEDGHPGQYFINTYAPETRPRYEAEVLAFHESIPGHHLQIAISQELKDVPAFRRNGGSTAFIEGWGLYSERLADEMGLYSGDLDRMGMLSFDSWRACRLVVDTGIHAMGWTRQQAIDYMVQNTCLAENNIANEVDRYISSPGQALAYKIGQREIFRLRAKAKDALGDKFNLKDFHDVVLGNGGVDLETLDAAIDEYIESQGRE